MYYLRTKSAVDAIAGLGIDMSKAKKAMETAEETKKIEKPVDLGYSSEELAQAVEDMSSGIMCSLDNPEDCVACSS
jgi:hypothetical protein